MRQTKHGPDRYTVVFTDEQGRKSKFITNSYNIKDVLDQARQMEKDTGRKIFPVENVIIKRRPLGDGKSAYFFEE